MYIYICSDLIAIFLQDQAAEKCARTYPGASETNVGAQAVGVGGPAFALVARLFSDDKSARSQRPFSVPSFRVPYLPLDSLSPHFPLGPVVVELLPTLCELRHSP